MRIIDQMRIEDDAGRAAEAAARAFRDALGVCDHLWVWAGTDTGNNVRVRCSRCGVTKPTTYR